MSHKRVLFRSEAREKILAGVTALVEAGIIDPTKVVRVALENAVSAASLLLLTEATLTEVRSEGDKSPAHEVA